MDIKHVLSCNPLRPAYADAADITLPGDAVPISLDRRAPGASSRSATTGDGFAFDNEGPRHDVLLAPVPHRRPARHQRRVAGLHGRRRLRAARAVAVRRLGHRAAAGLAGPALLGARRRRLGRVHARTACGRSTPPTRSSTSATTRPTPTPAGPAPGSRPRSSGRWPPGAAASRDATDRPRACTCTPPAAAPPPACGQAGTEVWEWTASLLPALPRLPAAARRGR